MSIQDEIDTNAVINTPAYGPNTLTIDSVLVGSGEWDDLIEEFKRVSQRAQYWPSLYWVDERGSVELLDSEGQVVPTAECEHCGAVVPEKEIQEEDELELCPECYEQGDWGESAHGDRLR